MRVLRSPPRPMLRQRTRLGVPAVVAAGLAGAFLAAPPMGTDLSAQVARAGFFAGHGWAPVDFGWYGGVSPYGYSLVSPPLMSWLGGGLAGPRLLGAFAAVLAAVALTALLSRTGAPRPVLGGAVGAACVVGNLVSGRITYGLGVAFGLLALLALTSHRAGVRLVAAPVAAALTAATSPVAGLFVGLAGTAWALSGLPRPARAVPDPSPGPARPGRAVPDPSPAGGAVGRAPAARLVEGALLAAGAGLPAVALAALFGAGGWMNISRLDTARAVGASLVVALLVPRRPVRVGAVLSALGVLAAYAVHTPVGLNATRLAAMFALPVLAAYGRMPSPGRRRRPAVPAALLAVAFAGVAVWQPPVSIADLRAAGDPASRAAYFAPLRAELARRAPVGRVEVVPLANYWDAAYVPAAAPLARGWLRQADLARNALFFDGRLTPRRYERWLRDNGVSHVAVAGAEPSWVGRAEAALIRDGLPYLTRVWRDGDWTLYEVAGRPAVLSGPARLVASTRGGVTLDATGPGEVLVRVRWSRWLAVRGGPGACLAPAGGRAVLRVERAGRYEVAGSLAARGPFCAGRAGRVSAASPRGRATDAELAAPGGPPRWQSGAHG